MKININDYDSYVKKLNKKGKRVPKGSSKGVEALKELRVRNFDKSEKEQERKAKQKARDFAKRNAK